MKNYGVKSEIFLDQKAIYDKKYMKVRFNNNEDLPVKETLKTYNRIIDVRFFS